MLAFMRGMRWALLALLLPAACSSTTATMTASPRRRSPPHRCAIRKRCNANRTAAAIRQCGPCPVSPEPTWGVCGSPCDSLDQAACAADPACRVVNYAECEISLNCLTNFMGCFPTDQSADTSVNCFTADSWQCSRSSACTALHSSAPCPTDAQCDRPFELCVPEGTLAGSLLRSRQLPSAPPDCPNGTTPGVANGCWTGACIPLDVCEQPP